MIEWKKVKLGELYEVHNGLSKGRQIGRASCRERV